MSHSPVQRVGVMGGTFDPVHYGHLIAANEVAAELNLDEVTFVPTGRPWQKEGTVEASGEDRYEMVRLATASNPLFTVSRVDLDRGGPTYTVDTLRDLRAAYGSSVRLFLLAGADLLASLTTWKEPERLSELATLVAMTRPGYAAPTYPGWQVVEVPELRLSSSDCRERVRRGAPLRYLLPPEVEQYLRRRGLYRGVPDGSSA